VSPQRKPEEKVSGHAVSVSQPLEFLRATTYRQRKVCQVLEDVTDGGASAEDIIEACQFLSVELFLHLFDESEDVVPLLRERCKKDDNIEVVLADILKEHALIKSLGLKVSKALMSQVAKDPSRKITRTLRTQATDLLEGLRRLSAIENGIILPIARARFGEADLEALSLSMATRRGWAT